MQAAWELELSGSSGDRRKGVRRGEGSSYKLFGDEGEFARIEDFQRETRWLDSSFADRYCVCVRYINCLRENRSKQLMDLLKKLCIFLTVVCLPGQENLLAD